MFAKVIVFVVLLGLAYAELGFTKDMIPEGTKMPTTGKMGPDGRSLFYASGVGGVPVYGSGYAYPYGGAYGYGSEYGIRSLGVAGYPYTGYAYGYTDGRLVI